DHPRHQAALDEFLATTVAPCDNLDLTLGRSAVLLVAALLYAVSDPAWPATHRLGTYGDELCDEISRAAEPHPHARAVLDVLATAAEPLERGCYWPLTAPEGHANDQHWPGWCHGNAGYVFLWNLARDVYGDDRFGELAARAAWLSDVPSGASSLCCGNAGQAYAALNQYRSS